LFSKQQLDKEKKTYFIKRCDSVPKDMEKIFKKEKVSIFFNTYIK
jgi:hypothetical protein